MKEHRFKAKFHRPAVSLSARAVLKTCQTRSCRCVKLTSHPVLVFLALGLQFTMEPAHCDLTLKQRTEILMEHNKARAKLAEGYNALDMLLMQWDNELEIYAQDRVKSCPSSVSGFVDASRQGMEKNIGANLAFVPILKHEGNESSEEELTMEKIITDEWVFKRPRDKPLDEQVHCFKDGNCEAYALIVWDATYLLGCAMKECGDTNELLCLYSPAAQPENWRPPLYKADTCQCTDPRFRKCFNHLCGPVTVNGWPEPPPPGIENKYQLVKHHFPLPPRVVDEACGSKPSRGVLMLGLAIATTLVATTSRRWPHCN